MAKIFISYRRVDDYGGVGRMFDRLEAHFGQGNVFVDVDSNMPLGVDFRAFITNQVSPTFTIQGAKSTSSP